MLVMVYACAVNTAKGAETSSLVLSPPYSSPSFSPPTRVVTSAHDDSAGVVTGCIDPRIYGAIMGNPGAAPGAYVVNTRAVQRALDEAGHNAAAAATAATTALTDIASTTTEATKVIAAAAPTATATQRVKGQQPTCVSVQGGDYVAGTLRPRSGTTLRVEAGARLLSVVNKTESIGFLVLENVSDVDLAGGGTVYGNAEHYISHFQPEYDRFEPTAPDGGRPRLVHLMGAHNVSIRDLRLENASDWHLHIAGSHSVVVDGVQVRGDARFPNNDGIDPDSSTDVTIRNCDIDVADDGICLKATRGLGPLARVLVVNTTIRSRSHAIKFGSNTDEEMHHVLFENITVRDSNGGLAIQARGPGDIHNVTFRNVRVETRYCSPRWWGNGDWFSITAEPRNIGDAIGRTYDICLQNVTARTENGGLVSGRAHGVQNLTLRNVRVTLAAWSNFSTGDGPPCALAHTAPANRNTTCMGTADHRPAAADGHGCGYTCREAALADGLRLENVQGALLDGFHVIFEHHIAAVSAAVLADSARFGTAKAVAARPSWYGKCVRQTNGTSDVKVRGGSCVL